MRFVRAPLKLGSPLIYSLGVCFSDGLRRSFPTSIERALSQGDVDSFSAQNDKVLKSSVPES
jgi:hypothetical protein